MLSKNSLPSPRSQVAFMFFSRNCVVLGFAFRSVIYFDLTFMYGISYELRSFFFYS